MLDVSLQKTAVLGAAGKMGKGIALLLLQEMTMLDLKNNKKSGSGKYVLTLIDTFEKALFPLRDYLREHITKFAEKNINQLRTLYSENQDLVSNYDIIQSFVRGSIDMIKLEKRIDAVTDSKLIFEAILEDIDIKVSTFSYLAEKGLKNAYFFSNTSSIPIKVLADLSGLKDRLIGFHFYNPPSVQKRLELIPSAETDPKLISIAEELALRLGKIIVFSKDVAGFIGNGHFIREIDFALKKVKALERKYSDVVAMHMINSVTEDLLVRPMGIFQLLDYVGLDIANNIQVIMSKYLKEPFEIDLINSMLSSGVKSFYHYKDGKPDKIYSLQDKSYVDIPKISLEKSIIWKDVKNLKDRDKILQNHFEKLAASDDFFAKLAEKFIENDRKIAKKLIDDGVCKKLDDLNIVLKNGFYHLWTF